MAQLLSDVIGAEVLPSADVQSDESEFSPHRL
jgi:hypothetical protein